MLRTAAIVIVALLGGYLLWHRVIKPKFFSGSSPAQTSSPPSETTTSAPSTTVPIKSPSEATTFPTSTTQPPVAATAFPTSTTQPVAATTFPTSTTRPPVAATTFPTSTTTQPPVTTTAATSPTILKGRFVNPTNYALTSATGKTEAFATPLDINNAGQVWTWDQATKQLKGAYGMCLVLSPTAGVAAQLQACDPSQSSQQFTYDAATKHLNSGSGMSLAVKNDGWAMGWRNLPDDPPQRLTFVPV